MEINNKKKRVIIFDTTLRDGEQSPGCAMGKKEKRLVAQQLAKLGVDVIEAGFPITSPGDAEAVRMIAAQIDGPIICALARARTADIEAAAKALEKAKCQPRIHTFIATSDVHMHNKLRKSPAEIIEMATKAVTLAKKYTADVEFSPEDASRSGQEFLAEIIAAAIAAGATTINVPDTTGYSVGNEYAELIKYLRTNVAEIDQVVLSAHCHNDLGLAVANTLTGVTAGIRQVEGCIMGIGERAGNAQLEAIIMALKTRQDFFNIELTINTENIGPTARLISTIIGKPIADTLPIVGGNAFAHGAGIHQDGVLKCAQTYENMNKDEVGWEGQPLPLVKHSGRHGLKERLAQLGYDDFDETIMEKIYDRFKIVADTKSYIYDEDLHWLVSEVTGEKESLTGHELRLIRVDYHCVNNQHSATVTLGRNGNELEASGQGDGAVSSVWQAIIKALQRAEIIQEEPQMTKFNIAKTSGGVEALGVSNITANFAELTASGRGIDPDIINACAKAMVQTINDWLTKKQ